MSQRIKPTILIAAALVLFAAVYALPGSVTATELLGITPTPDTPTPDTPTPDTPTPVTPTPDTPTPDTPTPDTPTPDTPTPVTPTEPVQPPNTPKPKETEIVLLPATGEYPIDPQLGIQLFSAFALFIVIGIVLFRAVMGSKAQE